MFTLLENGSRLSARRGSTVPTLVLSGSLDLVYSLAHGEALRDAVRRARLLVLDPVGHDLPRPVWPEIVDGSVEHSA